MCAGFSDEMLELLLFALEDLSKLLREQSSDLMIRFGSAENVIPELVTEVVILISFACCNMICYRVVKE